MRKAESGTPERFHRPKARPRVRNPQSALRILLFLLIGAPMFYPRLATLAVAVVGVACASGGSSGPASAPAPATAPGAATRFSIPVDYDTLPNGLKVVLSRDTTAPIAAIAV